MKAERVDIKNALDARNVRCLKFLDNTPGACFQHTTEWGKVITSLGHDEFWAITVERGQDIVGFMPVYLFTGPRGSILNSIPYPGPLGGVVTAASYERESIYSLALDKLDQFAKELGCVAATIISSPFHPDDELYRLHWNPTAELPNYTLCIDLTKPQETNSHFRNNLNRMLKKAQSNGFVVDSNTSLGDLTEWYGIHKARHEHLGLDPILFEIFSGALTYMVSADKGKFFYIKNTENKIVVGCFVAYNNQVVDTYLYSGDVNAYKNGAMYLLISSILEWAKNKGYKIFNWESSKPRFGGPYNFKMQWGSKELPYYFFTKVYSNTNRFTSVPLEQIKEEYKWHFVLPYSMFEQK